MSNTATASTQALDVERLARILSEYRLNRTEYFAPNLAPSGDRLMDEHEWASEIAERYSKNRRR